jgi:hypothetical protein
MSPEPKRLYDADAVDAYIDELHGVLAQLRIRVSEFERLSPTPPPVPLVAEVTSARDGGPTDPFIAELRRAVHEGTPDAFESVRRRWIPTGVG